MLRAEIGPFDSNLHVGYTQHRSQWTRTEQTYRGTRAADLVSRVAVTDPVQDLVSLVFTWGGPVAVEVSGLDPQDLLAALHPAMSNPRIQINGQTFDG